MAVIDDLVSSGLSGTQATEVIAVGAGTGSDAALVSQGFSTTQATAITSGGNIDELVQQGLFGTQAVAINEAVGTPPGPSTVTYTEGVDYSSTYITKYNSTDPVQINFYMSFSSPLATKLSTVTIGTPVTMVISGITYETTFVEVPIIDVSGYITSFAVFGPTYFGMMDSVQSITI